MIVDFLVQPLNWVTIQLQLLFTQNLSGKYPCVSKHLAMDEKTAIRIKFAV